MNRILIKDVKEGEEVSICGWIDSIRDHGNLIFVDIRDRTGKIQCVCRNSESAYVNVKDLTPESVVCVNGLIKEKPSTSGAKEVECVLSFVELISKADILPFEKDTEVSIEVLLNNRPLTLRNQKEKNIFLAQEKILQGFREYLTKNDFVEFSSPKLVGGDAEGGAEVFKLDYFGKEASLATSPQLYKQIMVGVYERVFTVGNVYRAEKHNTSRHLNEYTSLDFEVAFIEDYKDVMYFVEETLKSIRDKVQSLPFVDNSIVEIPNKIPVFTLKEVKEILKTENAPDLTPEEERSICEHTKKELNSDAVFVTEYPISKRPMYTMSSKEDPTLSKSFDLLLCGREVVTGSQRIHKYIELKKSIESRGLDSGKFEFYLQAFKYGMPAHGGCGMGLERMTAAFMNIKNIKEATLFPRDMTRIDTLFSE